MRYSVEDIKHHGQANTYIPHGENEEADCVLGFSFGYYEDETGISPGRSNEQLARYIEENFPTTPLILQFEIADALTDRIADMVIRESRTKGEYLHSLEIALQALEYMKGQNWHKVAIVTHPAMMARNDAMCRKLGMHTIAPAGLDVIEYDPNSAQSWTRNKEAWWSREEKVIDSGAANGLI